MKIAIIYHSLSGQTKKLAELLKAKLTQEQHIVSITELATDKPVKGGTIREKINFTVTNLPDLSEFDAICIGGPVWAFGPSTVVYKAILQLPDLKGKMAMPFTTMGFPLTDMGGKGAIKHMSKALSDKGAKVLPGIIIPKMFRKFDILMEIATNNCLEYFKDK